MSCVDWSRASAEVTVGPLPVPLAVVADAAKMAVLHAAKITRFQASVIGGRLRVGGTDARGVPARGFPNTRSGLSPPRLRLLSEGLHRRSAWAPEARRNSGEEPGLARLPAPLVSRRQPPGLVRH